MSKRLFIFSFAAILIVSFLFYRSSLNYYFIQDDFFHLNISRASSLKEFFEFFKFRDDIIGYRPISLQLFFFFGRKIFGLDPGGFRVISFTLLFSSFFLIIKIFKEVSGRLLVGFLTASLWVISSIHFMTITWISAGYIIIGTFFWLLTSYLFLKFVSQNRKIYYLLAVISFVATLASNEFSITWPFVFGFYYYFVLGNSPKKSAKIFAPFLFFLIMYLTGRLFFMKVPSISEYKLVINSSSVKTLFWYFLWTFNIPEEFKKQVVKNLIIFNYQFFREFWSLILISAIGAIGELTLGICYPFFCILRDKLKPDLKLVVFAILWFLISISPVLFLPNHNFIMYLALPSIGIYFLLAYLIVKSNKLFLIAPVMLIWLATSKNTLDFYKVNSYTITSQKVSSKFSNDMKRAFPKLPPNSIVYYPLAGPINLQAVMNQEEVKAIYDDPTISIYYNKEEMKKVLSDMRENRPVFIYSQ